MVPLKLLQTMLIMRQLRGLTTVKYVTILLITVESNATGVNGGLGGHLSPEHG